MDNTGDTYPQFSVGSLFSGIGGIELGLEQTGHFHTKWQVENNAYCRAILKKHWPSIPQHEDIHHTGKHNLESVDVLCGGFPCQDISFAGEREGIIHGKRSSLWFEFGRIIRELRPRYVIVENVAALRHITKKAGEMQPPPIAHVLADLAQSGYDAEWCSLYAYMFGLPHNRERVFIVAYPHGERRHTPIFHEPPVCPEEMDTQQGREKLDRYRATLLRFEQSISEPAIYGDNDGLPKGMERKGQMIALGNAVVPQCARWIGEQIVRYEQEKGTVFLGKRGGIVPQLVWASLS